MWFHYDWTIMSCWMPKTEIHVVDFLALQLEAEQCAITDRPTKGCRQSKLNWFLQQVVWGKYLKNTPPYEKIRKKNKHLWHKLHLFYPFTIQRFQHLLRHPKKPTWPTVSSSATTPEISRPGSRYLRKPMMKASLFTKAVFLGGGGGTWVGWIFLGRIHRIFAIGTCGGLHA